MTTPKRNEAVLRYDKRENDHSIELYEDGTFVGYADYAALQGEVSRLRAFAEHVRTTCFDFVNEGIRPWEHHMRELAWRADEALNLEPPTDGR